MRFSAEYWIKNLHLQRHPEGGFFNEVYRSDEIINKNSLHVRYGSERHHSTAIYFLIHKTDFSAFHRLNSDEIWHFYDGDAAMIHIIHPDGQLEQQKIGLDLEEGASPMVVIPKQSWFAAEMINKDSYALFGCTVAPGFDFQDFELARREALAKEYPQHKNLIEKLIH